MNHKRVQSDQEGTILKKLAKRKTSSAKEQERSIHDERINEKNEAYELFIKYREQETAENLSRRYYWRTLKW